MNANVLKYLGLAFQIAQEVATAEAQFAAGQPVNVPGVRTYIGKTHVELDLTIKQIP